MIRLRLFIAWSIFWFGPAALAEETPSPLWPSAPVIVSPVEAVIESFWNPRLKATARWRGENGVLTSNWDACFFNMRVGPSGGAAHMSRVCELELGDYQRLRVRLRPGQGVKTTIVAEVDGREQTIAEKVAATHDALEIAGPIRGRQLTGLTLKFAVERGASTLPPENEQSVPTRKHAIQLRWVMLEKDGQAWTPPKDPFKGMIVEQPVGRFEPGMGLLFGEADIRRMRDMVNSPKFDHVWKADLQYAERQYQVDPASLIRPYALYVSSRYGRDSDIQYETSHDGIILALIGLITRNEDYLRQAARHAIATAHIDHWAEGFVDRMPDSYWNHSAFAPNVSTITASLLLDWTWHYLTPAGRQHIRDAIAGKGLPFVERAKNAMANQGVRFNKGMILGRMALADSLDDPEVRTYVRACIDRINKKLDAIVRADGTFSEGMGYGKGTMASTPISYQAASRCLGTRVAELATPRMLPAMRFVLEAERGLDSTMAAFCAGPLGDQTFVSQCAPTGLIRRHGGSPYPTSRHAENRVEYVFFGLPNLWAPQVNEQPQPPALPTFSVYRDGGWIFGGNENPAQPRFSFESGLWDGQGHHWFHKNAVTLDGWGERLLISRFHLGYQDARSQYTMQTKLYNTFAPSGRNQNASGTRGQGARLLVAKDLGFLAVVESDNATAWRSGVSRAVRRMLFIRPSVMIVHDDAEFTQAEPGVQSWNSFQPWQRIDDRTCQSHVDKAAVRLRAVLPRQLSLTTGPDSVSRERGIEVPVHRAALTTDSSQSHNLLTLIESFGSDQSGRPGVRILETDPIIEVRSAGRVVQVAVAADKPHAGPLDGFSSDGRLLFIVREGDKVTHAGTCGATWLQTPDGRTKGEGFLHWPDR